MVKGWLKIKEPKDLETAIMRMLNKILASEAPIEHAGRFASLANAWINARRLRLEVDEVRKLKEEIDAFKADQARRG